MTRITTNKSTSAKKSTDNFIAQARVAKTKKHKLQSASKKMLARSSSPKDLAIFNEYKSRQAVLLKAFNLPENFSTLAAKLCDNPSEEKQILTEKQVGSALGLGKSDAYALIMWLVGNGYLREIKANNGQFPSFSVGSPYLLTKKFVKSLNCSPTEQIRSLDL